MQKENRFFTNFFNYSVQNYHKELVEQKGPEI